MEILIEIVFWFLEFLFTVVAEGVASVGHDSASARAAARRTDAGAEGGAQGEAEAGPLLTALAYGAFGAVCGVVSLWIAPTHYIGSPGLRWFNLIVTPVFAGYLVARWRSATATRERPADFNADWINGAMLAFALAATRLALAR